TKYAANAMLATKISLINEIAALCDRLGVDVENVRLGIGSDQRIGFDFIYPGCGYGGHCFPKDVKALVHTARQHGFDPQLLQAVDSRNQAQRQVLFEKIVERFDSDLSGKIFGVWGLAFKPGTDDMREAPAATLIEALIIAGASVRAFDPAAMESASATFPAEWLTDGRLILVDDQYSALDQADAMVLVTEWKPFRNPDYLEMLSRMKQPVIFDGRNQYDPDEVKAAGFEYFGIGRRG
ncbi:MAG: UDP-glucose/GDP-mannose dehydrogenase family protein, partial [Desulfuromonadales bacterium]|nr:UDP-glucose/GDP-mannose dehydrogenase family protein [Desulfuromonadales bacterium]